MRHNEADITKRLFRVRKCVAPVSLALSSYSRCPFVFSFFKTRPCSAAAARFLLCVPDDDPTDWDSNGEGASAVPREEFGDPADPPPPSGSWGDGAAPTAVGPTLVGDSGVP